jgi:nitrate/nitrite-specific signal transduction histidine kinase
MLFGGPDGIDLFFPEQIKPNPFIPTVALTALRLGGNETHIHPAPELVRSITLSGPQNELDFEFAALSYTQPEKNQLAYKLEGYDPTWHHIGTNRAGHYEGLPGGSYTLKLRGSNDDGVWNEEGNSLRITVVPPVWSTWWFRGASILVVLGLALAGYRLRVRNIQAQSRSLEAQVAERTREIEQRRHELEALYRADEELYRHLELDQVLQSLVDIAVDMLKADKSSVFCWDEGAERLVMRVARGFGAESLNQLSFARGEGLAGQVAATGQPAFMGNTAAERVQQAERPEVIAVLRAEAIRAFMLLPITVNDQVFGIFNVNYTVPHAFGRDEERLFAALAGRAARAIENAQLYGQTQELAALQERSRLARDLHDAVTQTLFSASLIAEALPELWDADQEEGRQLLAELRQLNRGALAEMRTLLLELRPATLVEANLGELLRQLGEAVTGRTGLPVSVTVRGQCSPPSDVHVALYRIAQEALNNVVKHANATHVGVSLSCTSGDPNIDREPSSKVELAVRDDGCGFDPADVPSDRLGLGIIRERTQAIGARLEINSQIDAGTQIVVEWSEYL